MVRSRKLAAAQERAVRQRRATAQQAMAALTVRRHGKKRFIQAAALRAAAEQIVAPHRVAGLLILGIETHPTEQQPRRRSGTRPADVPVEPTLTICAWGKETARATTLRRWGWRGSATNPLARQLSWPQAVLA